MKVTVMAIKAVLSDMVNQGHVAVRTFHGLAAGTAEVNPAEPTPVKEQDRLVAGGEGFFKGIRIRGLNISSPLPDSLRSFMSTISTSGSGRFSILSGMEIRRYLPFAALWNDCTDGVPRPG